MSSPRLICKLCLLLFCFTAIGTGNFSFAQPNQLISPDTIQTGDHYLDRQIVIVGHIGNQGEILDRPSTNFTFYPKLYYQSNFIRKKIWGGKIGTGMTVGLNYILLPYAAFSPEWRINNHYVKIDLGLQLDVGWNIGFVPFGGITIGNNYPLSFSKNLALKTEVGAQIIGLAHFSPLFPFVNLGITYRKSRKD